MELILLFLFDCNLFEIILIFFEELSCDEIERAVFEASTRISGLRVSLYAKADLSPETALTPTP